MATTPQDITTLLQAWAQGAPEALERLLPLIEKELRRLARSYLRREGPGHVLQTTALVNEAYAKLLRQNRVEWRNREQFYGVAALCMKRILLNYARKRQADEQLDSRPGVSMSYAQSVELLALKDALVKLARVDKRKCWVMELTHFGGYMVAEIADIVEVSEATVARDLRFARAWLYRELGGV